MLRAGTSRSTETCSETTSGQESDAEVVQMRLISAKPAILRATAALSSQKLGEQAPGSMLVILETKTLPDGRVRARTAAGWLTSVGIDGVALLRADQGEPDVAVAVEHTAGDAVPRHYESAGPESCCSSCRTYAMSSVSQSRGAVPNGAGASSIAQQEDAEGAADAVGEARRRSDDDPSHQPFELEASRREASRLTAQLVLAKESEERLRANEERLRAVASAAASSAEAELLQWRERHDAAAALAAVERERAERACAALASLLARAGLPAGTPGASGLGSCTARLQRGVGEASVTSGCATGSEALGPSLEARGPSLVANDAELGLAWVDDAAGRLAAWVADQSEYTAELELSVQRAKWELHGVKQTAVERAAVGAERTHRAEQRSQRLVGALRAASRQAADQSQAEDSQARKSLESPSGSEPDAVGAGVGSRQYWLRRARVAEAHNERVGQLLGKYVTRNALALPSMPACVVAPQMMLS